MVWVRCFDHLRRLVVTIERKGSEDLAKASAPAVDQSYLGQAPKSMVQFRLENLLHNETLSSNRIATFWPKTVW